MANGEKAASSSVQSKPPSQTHSTSYFVTFMLCIIALLLGVVIQQNIATFQAHKNTVDDLKNDRPFDMKAAFTEMSQQLRDEIIQLVRSEIKKQKPEIASGKDRTNKQDEIYNEKPRIELPRYNNEPGKVTIDEKSIKEKDSGLKFKPGEPVVLDPSQIKIEDKETVKKPTNSEATGAAKDFASTMITKIKPKKMWIPIPNSNGGHRRVPAVEVTAGKSHGSSVKVWVYEEFLSKEECEQLIHAHESHLAEMKKQKPIICFDTVNTLKRTLTDLNRTQVAETVTEADFTDGTLCLNQTFSRQLEKWGLKWSYSTAFYPGESKFSKVFGKLIQEATQLEDSHGGKYQITSYPADVGYKSHTDCVVGSRDPRDRYATFLVYLNDLGPNEGGETIFSELGIDVRPREGRALTWNNMNYETGECEAKSIHEAAKVKHPVKKKYIIQRWYYYKSFYGLGKRAPEPALPARPDNTPRVSCDEYDFGSCRMYDEWSMDHVIEYLKDKKPF